MTVEDRTPGPMRPFGVSVLAVLAGIGFVVGLLVIVTAMGGAAVVHGGPLALVVVPMVITVAGASAYGLWGLRWWAWPLAILTWISAGAQALVGLGNGSLNTDLVVAPIAIAYLLQPGVRTAFGRRVSEPGRLLAVATSVLVLVAALLPFAGTALASWTPTVPADAGTTELARISVPLASPSDDASSTDDAYVDGTCLERASRPAGWLDLCWTVTRLADLDPDGDYYRFEAHGTFGSDATDTARPVGSGIRWLVLRNHLLTPVLDGVSSGRPDGTVTGCTSNGDDTMFYSPSEPELPCDGTTVGADELQWHTVTWTCLGCLIPDKLDRAIGLSEVVKVAEGATPSWILYADFGS